MKNFKFITLLSVITLFASCDNDDDNTTVDPSETTNFTVSIENIGSAYSFIDSGIFNTPVGDAAPGPATPGKRYEFTVNAGRSQKLSFATMLAATNDLFFAPEGNGIALYDDNGDPISGDVTDQVYLWDAGTEVNEEPAVGPNTVGMQSGPDTGEVENGNVLKIADVTNGFIFDYPEVNEIISVSITHTEGTMFTVSIEDLSTASLDTSAGMSVAPLSPGVYVIHGDTNPLFTEGEADYGQGVEGISEDGNATPLGEYTADNTGVTYPSSPGIFVVHEGNTMPLFTSGVTDYDLGLEHIAEDGNTAVLADNLSGLEGQISGAVFNTVDGGSGPGPLLPGNTYTFSFTAEAGNSLSFASMLAATNDVLFATQDTGIELFSADGTPLSGDITNEVYLWDAGTEVNEQPAIGPNTVTNQLAADTGIDETEQVQLLSNINDGFDYPSVNAVLKITITAN
ncbi:MULTISPECIES: spondin domain-containing protein [Winogradskyella]|uniref:spondin domain-containing protein n=1 Tax=Winogradskyella TaxID=286104 RepID=UPI0015C86CFA|nr:MULTISPECIES: spondin domain-containing protein [Winogradskyella]QXP80541.1 spondin domain-containing protein [Winogradskyella sp. HaHa_3_26]